MRRIWWAWSAIVVLLATWAVPATARHLDGTLSIIQRPISTLPVIVKAGETFPVTLAVGSDFPEVCRGALYRGEQEYDLELPIPEAARRVQARMFTAQVRVPPEVPPGLYGFQVALRPGIRADNSERAVKVVKDWPQAYRFAHVTDVHIGKPPDKWHAGPVPEGVDCGSMFQRTAAEINRLGVDFVLITGDITESAQPEQFRTFLQVLDLFEVPTFVTPGNHDRGAPLGATLQLQTGEPGQDPIWTQGIYDRYCGPAVYTFDLGRHRYVSLDTRWEEEFLINNDFRGWLQGLLARPDPALGIVFSHRISEQERPYYARELPGHNYRAYVYGHTHDDEIAFGDLTLINTSHEFVGTYSVVTVADDKVALVRHYHHPGVW